MNEQWLPIPDYENLYDVSDQGSVWSRKTDRLIGSNASGGYIQVALSRHDGIVNYRVHRLVMLAFVGTCPKGMEVHHINENRTDNRLENLMYVTHEENVHASAIGERHPRAKLTEEDICEIKRLYATGDYSMQVLADIYGMARIPIRRIIRGTSWTHIECE